MKKYLIVLTLLLTLGATAPAAAQTQQRHQQKELVDSTKLDELEAFSDTTEAYEDSIIASSSHYSYNVWDDEDAKGLFGNILRQLNADDIAGMFFALAIILIIFVLSPLVIFGLLLYFIFRNRKQKMKLAQMAVQNGQPIPDQLLNEQLSDDADTYQKGMRQVFLGIGLMVFLGITAGKVGLGIGALVFFIGLGKVLISRKSVRDQNLNSPNQTNINRYE